MTAPEVSVPHSMGCGGCWRIGPAVPRMWRIAPWEECFTEFWTDLPAWLVERPTRPAPVLVRDWKAEEDAMLRGEDVVLVPTDIAIGRYRHRVFLAPEDERARGRIALGLLAIALFSSIDRAVVCPEACWRCGLSPAHYEGHRYWATRRIPR